MTDNIHGLALTPPATSNANDARAGNANQAGTRGRRAGAQPPAGAPAPEPAPAPAPEPAPAADPAPAPEPAPAQAGPAQEAIPLTAQTAAIYEARIAALANTISAYRTNGGTLVPDESAPGQETIAALELPAVKEPARRVLPAIVPGHKANALDNAIPPRVDQAFAAFQYVPYTALSRPARAKALNGDAEVVIANGSLIAKGLDKSGETSITTLEWLEAAAIAVRRTRYHHAGLSLFSMTSSNVGLRPATPPMTCPPSTTLLYP
ncbi:hypothetical protein BJ912DRAFT_921890 [Pholiota molesta]|nr:hypothetical protein BJ912DRAFT_921890 [Pholiota molesta]